MQEPSDVESSSSFSSRVKNPVGYGICPVHKLRKISMDGVAQCPSCAIPPGQSKQTNTLTATNEGFKEVINSKGEKELVPIKSEVLKIVSQDTRQPETVVSGLDGLTIVIPKELLFDIHNLVQKKLKKISPIKEPQLYKIYLDLMIELNRRVQ